MQAAIFRHHITHTVFIKHATDNLDVGALCHFHNAAFRAATTILAGDAYQDAITVQGFLHLAVIQKDVGALVAADRGFRACKTKAIRVAFNTAGDEVSLGR